VSTPPLYFGDDSECTCPIRSLPDHHASGASGERRFVVDLRLNQQTACSLGSCVLHFALTTNQLVCSTECNERKLSWESAQIRNLAILLVIDSTAHGCRLVLVPTQ